jgi:hypothetical protein
MRAFSWALSSAPLPSELYDGAALSEEEAANLEHTTNSSRFDAAKRRELGFGG